MKKLISLAAAALITGMAFAQDTIPPPGKKNFQDPSKVDTSANNWKDTSSLNPNNKWPDTSLNKNGLDNPAKQADTASLNPNNKWPDTTLKSNSSTPPANTIAPPATTAPATTAPATTAPATTGPATTAPATTAPATTAPATTAPATTAPATDAATKTDATTTTTTTTTQATQDSAAAIEKKVEEDRVIMKEDQVMVVKSGDTTALDQSITLKSGAVVTKDGTVKYSNGTTAKLKNGQYINLNPAETKKGKKSKKDS